MSRLRYFWRSINTRLRFRMDVFQLPDVTLDRAWKIVESVSSLSRLLEGLPSEENSHKRAGKEKRRDGCEIDTRADESLAIPAISSELARDPCMLFPSNVTICCSSFLIVQLLQTNWISISFFLEKIQFEHTSIYNVRGSSVHRREKEKIL